MNWAMIMIQKMCSEQGPISIFKESNFFPSDLKFVRKKGLGSPDFMAHWISFAERIGMPFVKTIKNYWVLFERYSLTRYRTRKQPHVQFLGEVGWEWVYFGEHTGLILYKKVQILLENSPPRLGAIFYLSEGCQIDVTRMSYIFWWFDVRFYS